MELASSEVYDLDELNGGQRQYYEDVHRVSVPKPLEGEKLGLTVQLSSGCLVVTRILSGGVVDASGAGVELGDILLEVNNIPVSSVDELMALIGISDKQIHLLVKKTPAKDLKRYGIPNTPSLRKQMQRSAAAPEQRTLCHLRALFDYDPYEVE